MRVGVRLFSTLGELAGRRRLSLDLADDASLADLVRALEALPEWEPASESPEYAWRHGSTDFTAAVNGRNVTQPAWEETRLREGDDIWLQPPIAGG